MVEFTYNLTVRTPATLNFITSGRPTPSLTLYKKDKNTMEYVEVFSERFTVQLIGIKISSVEPEDDGDYKLVANYTESYNDTEEFTIFVHSKSSLHRYDTCMDSVFTHTYCNYTALYISYGEVEISLRI